MTVDIRKGDCGAVRRKDALVRRIAREFQVRQANGVDDDLIGVDVCRSFEAFGSGAGDVVVLIHAIAAHAQSAHENAVLIERQAAWEENDSALI